MSDTGEPEVNAATIEFDPYDQTASADEVWQKYAEMRAAAPVVSSSCHGGFDIATHHAEVRAVAADHRRFSSAHGLGVVPIGTPPIPPLEFDEPEHRRWQKLMEGPLTLQAVRAKEAMIQEVIDGHLDRLDTAGTVDLYADFAALVPVHVLCRIVGLSPDASAELRRVAMELFAAFGRPEIGERMAAFTAFTERELDERRQHPRDDYLSQIASGELNGEQISPDEAVGVLLAMLLGGHHSTSAAIAGVIHHALVVPGLRDELTADPSLVPAAVEESLRLTTPLQLFARTALEDAEVGDKTVAADHKVVLNFAAANRDEQVFPDADTFDLHRAANNHLAWGHGIHLCIGRYLARAEIRIALHTLLSRFPELRLAGDVVESGLTGGSMMSIVSLPAALT